MEGKYKNRYDVTLLINGLPLVQIELKHRGLVVLWCPRLIGIAFLMINAWSVYQSQIVTIDFFQVSQPANVIKARDELLVTYLNVNERVSLAKSFGDDVLFIG